jgi:hypothetical protein
MASAESHRQLPRFDPDTFTSLKCEKCGNVMRLVGLEPYAKHSHIHLHTYECICGEIEIIEASYN